LRQRNAGVTIAAILQAKNARWNKKYSSIRMREQKVLTRSKRIDILMKIYRKPRLGNWPLEIATASIFWPNRMQAF
jgi:hypothetical protein